MHISLKIEIFKIFHFDFSFSSGEKARRNENEKAIADGASDKLVADKPKS